MFYNLYEAYRELLKPLNFVSGVGADSLSNPLNPFSYTPLAIHLKAAYGLTERLSREYAKPEWGITSTVMRKRNIDVIKEVVLEKPFCDLIHFKRDTSPRRKPDPKVLLVAPLSGHHATLLRDTVNTMLPKHEVYVTDWKDARLVPLSEGKFGLNEYVRYVEAFIKELGPDVHVIAVCQPTAPVMAAVALMSVNKDKCTPKSVTLMGGPVDAREGPTQVTELAKDKSYEWFEQNMISTVPSRYPGAGRKVYPGFLQLTGFVAMNPSNHLNSHVEYVKGVVAGDEATVDRHEKFYDNYNSVLDMPAEFFLETLHTVFQEFKLAKGTWEIDGKLVDLNAIKDVALFTIEGELDDITGEGQTHAAQELCGSIPKELKEQYTAPGCGHYGVFSGSKWRELIYPKIDKFIRKHN